jgi:magnesium transporter
VALAALMPIVASTGGHRGDAVAGRGGAGAGDARPDAGERGRVVRRELVAGGDERGGLALILGAAGSLIFGDWHLGWCWAWR